MTELEAAIAIEQFKKFVYLNDKRIELANRLTSNLSNIEGLSPPITLEGNKSLLYVCY